MTSGGGGQGAPGKILAFDIAADGTPSNRRDFTTLQSGNGDGLAVDTEGRLYVTSGDVEVYAPDGTYLGQVRVPAGFVSYVRRGDQVWGVEFDEDDVPRVARFRIAWR